MFYSKEVLYEDMLSLWRDASVLIVINHNPRVAEIMRTREKKKIIEFIQIPDRESFEIRHAIIAKVRAIIAKRKLTRKNVRIIISGGIGAKAVVHDLANEFILYDVGTLFGFSELDKNPALKDTPKKRNRKLLQTN